MKNLLGDLCFWNFVRRFVLWKLKFMRFFLLISWTRHSWMPQVYKLKHDFENLDFWGKYDFFFPKMDEAWLNAPSLKMDAWFLEILIFFFFFWKWMRHGQMALVQLSMCILKNLIVWGPLIKKNLNKTRSKSQNWVKQGLLEWW